MHLYLAAAWLKKCFFLLRNQSLDNAKKKKAKKSKSIHFEYKMNSI